MALRIEQRPIPQIEQARPAEASSFSKEKITRIALRVLSLLAMSGVILLGAHVIVGTISALHLLSMLALYLVLSKASTKAGEIVDLNDPEELKSLKVHFCGNDITEMLNRYSLDTIFRYNLVPLDLLRVRCCVNLLDRKYHPLPVLKKNADGLLQHKIITPEIYRALVADNGAELNRLVPGNRIDLGRMFAAFDLRG